MSFKKLSKRTVFLSGVTVALPSLATCWLLFSVGPLPASLESGIPSPHELSVAEPPRGSPEQGAPEATSPPAEAALIVGMGRQRVAGEPRSSSQTQADRYLDLRSATVADCEEVVLHAGTTQEDRFLAVNALGSLSRTPGGRPALERLTKSAPSEELRGVARILLARR